MPAALHVAAIGKLQLLAVGDAERFLQGVHAVIDRVLVGGQPVDDLLGGQQPLLAVEVGVGIDDPAAGELQEAVLHLGQLLLELVLLGVGAGDGADAAGDQRLPAVAVLHAGVPAELRRRGRTGLTMSDSRKALPARVHFSGSSFCRCSASVSQVPG